MSDYEPGYDDDVVYEDGPARSSIAGPLIRALFAAAIAFGIYALVFGDVGGGGDLDLADDQATAVPPTVEAPATDGAIQIEPGGTEPVATPTGTASPAPDAAAPGGQVGAGVTVQVIAGSGTSADQVDAAVQVLTGLGYDVVRSGISPNAYPQTTIFATVGEEALAQALQGADNRFTTIGENPGTLTTDIPIHVLVGEDWPIGAAAEEGAAADEG